MKRLCCLVFSWGGGDLLSRLRQGFTLGELSIVLVVMTLVVMVTLPITLSKMKKVDYYSYYMGYNAVKSISANVLADLLDFISEYEELKNNKPDEDEEDEFADRPCSTWSDGTIDCALLPAFHIYPSSQAECENAIEKYTNYKPINFCKTPYKYITDTLEICGSYVSAVEAETTVPFSKSYLKSHVAGVTSTEKLAELGIDTYDVQNVIRTDYFGKQYSGTNYSFYIFNYTSYGTHDEFYQITLRDENGKFFSVDKDDYTPRFNSSTGDYGCQEWMPCWSEWTYPDQSLVYSMCYERIEPEEEEPPIEDVSYGLKLCEYIKDNYNIDSSDCSIDVSIVNNKVSSKNFSSLTPHIVFSNGLKLYIGSDLVTISELSDAEDELDREGFEIYIDVNGESGKSILWEDVFPFYLLKSGKVIAAYNESSPSGGNNMEHLKVNVVYDDYSGPNRALKLLMKDANFRSAACAVGYIKSSKYCDGKVQYDLCKDTTRDCRMMVKEPIKIF